MTSAVAFRVRFCTSPSESVRSVLSTNAFTSVPSRPPLNAPLLLQQRVAEVVGGRQVVPGPP
jgi:hypothetical protein